MYCKPGCNGIQDPKTERSGYQDFILTASYLYLRSGSCLLAHFCLLLFDKLETALSIFTAIGGRPTQQNRKSFSLFDKPFITDANGRLLFLYLLLVSPKKIESKQWSNETISSREGSSHSSGQSALV